MEPISVLATYPLTLLGRANLPANKLAQYMQLIQGNYGGSTTSKQPVYQPSLASQIVGGLGTAAGIGLGLA